MWRRGLFLLIGGLVAIPYAIILAWAVAAWLAPGETRLPGLFWLRAAVFLIVALLAVPAFLPITRTLERTAANQLLDLSVPEPTHRASAVDVARGALYFAGHLFSGGLLVFALGFALPLAVTFVVDAATGSADAVGIARGVLPEIDTDTAVMLTLATTGVALMCTVGAGILLPWYSTMLLGPSAEEQLRAAAARTAALARRNDLARELHDTIGHALTVTTMQAALARRTLESEPERTLAALAEIERAGRAAVADLDYALGILRQAEPGEPGAARGTAPTAPQRTLGELDELVTETSAAGIDLRVIIDDDLSALPTSLGREAYRIVQEGLTNALRHASVGRATLTVTVTDDVSITVVNPATRVNERAVDTGRGGSGDGGNAREGRGLAGIRERVALLGGTCVVGQAGGEWRLTVHLPLSAAPVQRMVELKTTDLKEH